DARRVDPDQARKSVGRETTFGEDVADREAVARTLLGLVEEVGRRLRRAGLAGRVVHVKLRTADFATVTRQRALDAPADTTEAIWPAARELFTNADTTRQAIRLIGVSLSDFDSQAQLGLFASERDQRRRRVAHAIDALVARFGDAVVRRGG
ncbi:MAG TPA: hypothetical protein VGC36_00790, partial [Rhizomicrobium sp.]